MTHLYLKCISPSDRLFSESVYITGSFWNEIENALFKTAVIYISLHFTLF